MWCGELCAAAVLQMSGTGRQAGEHLKIEKREGRIEDHEILSHRVKHFNHIEARVDASLLMTGLAALSGLVIELSTASALSGKTSRSSKKASRYGVRSTSAPTVTM